jgi:hypothetical protein
VPARIDCHANPEVGQRLPLPRIIEGGHATRLLHCRDSGLYPTDPQRLVLQFGLQLLPRPFQRASPCLDLPQLGKHRLQGIVTLFQFRPETSKPRLLSAQLLDTLIDCGYLPG